MKVAFYTACLLFLMACQNKAITIVSHEFSLNEWPTSEVIEFPLSEVHDALILRVNHLGDYAYENLYVRLTYGDTQQVVSIPLMNNQGYWLGTKSGVIYSADYMLPDVKDVEVVSVEQYARTQVLSGVHSIALVAQANSSK